MTTHETGTRTGTAAGRALAQRRTMVARTADLVRKLTALADRYEATGSSDERAADRQASVALMRATAEAGRQLLRSLVPSVLPLGERPAPPPPDRGEVARSRDAQAAARDAAAEARDVRAAQRDRRVRAVAGDDDLDFAGRFLAACDRDSSAGDRAAALGDRRAAQADREPTPAPVPVDLDSQARTYALVARLQERAVVRQAQGVLMERAGMTAGQAFEALLLAASGPMSIEVVAQHVIRYAEIPAAHDGT